MPAPRTRLIASLGSGLGLGLATTTLALVPAPAHAATVDITLLNINDFHGRIDANTTKFATTIERIRAEAGEADTLLLSAGDNIGASLFASSHQQDQPTLDVLDALGLAGSAVGNHEFDRGFADLDGRVQAAADFDYLGANVYERGTTTPALDPYATYEVGGLTVGVIGAITEETSSLVSPAGIAGLTFGDPVAAVNRVAARLSDGNDANGEADVIVAEYHEGAGAGTPDGSSLAEEVAGGGTFSEIVEDTAASVDVIFTGHTHKQYAWTAPVPGAPGRTRPVVQTGSYGENIGRVDLTVDDTTGEVTAATAANVARAQAEDLTLPRVQEVKEITDAALAAAADVGNRPVGTITADITTAYADGKRDDRASESTLGGLVANALRDGVSSFAEPDLGLTNSGGLRAELLFAGAPGSNPANTDGVVTFAEANAVLPFNNTVAIVELPGSALRTVLEQQWQTTADGSVASRPYLQLALSDNVRVTADPTRPAGSRITSVRIDGKPLDEAATYTVSTLSFLAAGGDNFRAFTDGRFTDTGLLDAELWRTYLAGSSPITPSFTQRQVFSTIPATVRPGTTVSFRVERLGLTSLGAPPDSTVTATLGGTTIGTFPVVDRAAEIALKVPASARGGDVITLTSEQGAILTTRVVKVPATLAVAKLGRAKVGRAVRLRVAVTTGGGPAAGEVTLFRQGRATTLSLGKNGRVTVRLAPYGKPGPQRVRVKYVGNGATRSDTQTVRFWVRKK